MKPRLQQETAKAAEKSFKPSASSCAKNLLIQEFEQEPTEAAEKISRPSASSAFSCAKNLLMQEFEQETAEVAEVNRNPRLVMSDLSPPFSVPSASSCSNPLVP